MVDETEEKIVEQRGQEKADQLDIIYYTDPLCCWSWGMEPQLRKLQFTYSGQVNWRYCMGGLLSGWKNYHDDVNSVSRPIQMGPVWMHAQQVSGMPMDSVIWMRDPPASSYLACIAVKCAELQSKKCGQKYLRLLRETIMLEGKNIAKEDVLVETANKLSELPQYDFQLEKFKSDLNNDNGLEAFRKDLQEVQYKNINRFPTMIIKGSSHKGIIVTGYRPYSILMEAIKQVHPQAQNIISKINLEEYINYWETVTKREVEEIKHN